MEDQYKEELLKYFATSMFKTPPRYQIPPQQISSPYFLSHHHPIQSDILPTARREPIQISPIINSPYPLIINNTIVLPNQSNKTLTKDCNCKKQEQQQKVTHIPNIPNLRRVSSEYNFSRIPQNNLNSYRYEERKPPLKRYISQSKFDNNELIGTTDQHQRQHYFQDKVNNASVKEQKKQNKKNKLFVQCCQQCFKNLYVWQNENVHQISLKNIPKISKINGVKLSQQRENLRQKLQKLQRQRIMRALELQKFKFQVEEERQKNAIQTKSYRKSQLETEGITKSMQINTQSDKYFMDFKKDIIQSAPKYKYSHQHQKSHQIHANKFLSTNNCVNADQTNSVIYRKDSIKQQSQLNGSYKQQWYNPKNKFQPSKQKLRSLENIINTLKQQNKKLWDLIL